MEKCSNLENSIEIFFCSNLSLDKRGPINGVPNTKILLPKPKIIHKKEIAINGNPGAELPIK